MSADRPENAYSTKASANAPCAMIPLKPNELSRPKNDRWLLTPADASAGISNCDDTIENKCVFDLERSEFTRSGNRGAQTA